MPNARIPSKGIWGKYNNGQTDPVYGVTMSHVSNDNITS